MGIQQTPLTVHPAARLFLACCWIAAAFLAPTAGVLLAAPMAFLAFDQSQRRRWLTLVWRSRWLLLTIVLAVGLSEPGEYIIPGLPGTREGLLAAGGQLTRILASLMAVSWLLAIARNELIGGLLGLGGLLGRRARPAVERLALRLVLVLELVENRRGHWIDLLSSVSAPVTSEPMKVHLSSLDGRDRGLSLMAVAVLCALITWRCW